MTLVASTTGGCNGAVGELALALDASLVAIKRETLFADSAFILSLTSFAVVESAWFTFTASLITENAFTSSAFIINFLGEALFNFYSRACFLLIKIITLYTLFASVLVTVGEAIRFCGCWNHALTVIEVRAPTSLACFC